MSFQQIASSGAYQYMRANLSFSNDISLLCSVYDHYVHYLMAEKYKKEIREEGKNNRDEEKKVVQRARQRLRDRRYRFAVLIFVVKLL
ncbi:hypothetical protein O181_126188 [Austropuccinia psidii MF-1]|uniref:Uncharacterized protein n=1 Tax=Austropuccinia psidii MF-1 TaxID=1389203 RepID=A0A9Q3Q5R9_9BASI|nr:hypothetical protein [Austropuccinia psidii MF-1]